MVSSLQPRNLALNYGEFTKIYYRWKRLSTLIVYFLRYLQLELYFQRV